MQKDPKRSVEVEYDKSGSTPITVVDDYNKFFVNLDDQNCPITKCQLKESGCFKSYSAPNLAIEFVSGNKFEINVKTLDVIHGWSETVCVFCSNGIQSLTFDDFKVSQRSKCVSVLSASATQVKPLVLKYDETDLRYELITDWRTEFLNEDKDNCPIKSCSILTEKCDQEFISDKVKFESAFRLSFSQNVEEGYDLKICIKCTNGLQSVTKDNFLVT